MKAPSSPSATGCSPHHLIFARGLGDCSLSHTTSAFAIQREPYFHLPSVRMADAPPATVDELDVDEGAFDLHRYVCALEGLTPLTSSASIPAEVHAALVALYPVLHKAYFAALRTVDKGGESLTPFSDPGMSWLDLPALRGLPSMETAKAWGATLDATIAASRLREAGCFPRLSSRSPKDSLALRRRGDDGASCICRSGLDVVELLAMSERVYDELQCTPVTVCKRVAWCAVCGLSFVCGLSSKRVAAGSLSAPPHLDGHASRE